MRKNIAKRIACAVVALVMTLSAFSAFAAAQLIEPYYNNASDASNSAEVSSSGKLKITNRLLTKKPVFDHAVITTYVEKKTLGLFWTKVDIGQDNDEWTDVIYSENYSGTHTVQLSSKGTYRVTTEFVVYGSGGSADKITRTSTVEYK